MIKATERLRTKLRKPSGLQGAIDLHRLLLLHKRAATVDSHLQCVNDFGAILHTEHAMQRERKEKLPFALRNSQWRTAQCECLFATGHD